MNLNFVKLQRKLNYGKNLIQYAVIMVIAKLLSFKQQNIVKQECFHCTKHSEIVFLGEIEKALYLHDTKFFYEIAKTADYPGLMFCYSEIAEQGNPYKMIGDTAIFNTGNTKCSLIQMKQGNIGYALFDFNAGKSVFKWKIDILRRKILLRRNNADFLIAYVKGAGMNRKEIGSLKKIVGTWGFDCVIGIDKKIKGKRNFRTLAFHETRILYSLGGIGREPIDENEKAECSIAYKIQIEQGKRKAKLLKEGYLPLLVQYRYGEIDSIKELKKDLWKDEIEKSYYLFAERIMRGLRPWRNLILMKDIFDVLGERIPQRYEALLQASVNQICARTYELSPGNVFFFRRAFRDKNDLKVENEIWRYKLVLRALTRKSLFVFSYKKLPTFIPHIVIENPTEAHIKIMAWYREKFITAKYIGVTGSTGKTSTKDMLFSVLKQGFHAERNIRNSNVQVKIGINEQKIASNTELYVQEIGGGRPGGASRHSRMILPDAAIITNIGTAHIGNFESQEALRDSKLGITEGMCPDGMLFLNGDDPLLMGMKPSCRVTYFALQNKNADYYADNIEEDAGVTYFDIVASDKVLPAKINVLGEYNVLNAVCSYAVAKHFGMDDEDIIAGLRNFKTTGIRQNIINVGGFRFFVDCYNASVDSIQNALSVLSKLVPDAGGKRVAVIGDVTGMGEMQSEINQRIAETIAEYGIDQIVCYGKNAEDVSSTLEKNCISTICIKERQVLEQWLSENLQRGDVTLLKGSSKVKLDEILDSVFGLNLSDQRYMDEAHYSTLRKNKSVYKVFEEYASLTQYHGEMNRFVVPNKVLQKKVKKITKKAFYYNQFLKRVKVCKNVVHIGSFAFAGCRQLEEIEFNGSIKFVGKEAFKNCIRLKRVRFDENLVYIGSNAFKNCKKLEEIIVPRTIGKLGKQAVQGTKAKLKYI